MTNAVNFVSGLHGNVELVSITRQESVNPDTFASTLTHSIPDSEICQKLRDNDESALRFLMDRHGALVLRLAMNVLSDRQEAEDVAQEVFLSVWNNRASWIEGQAKFSTWIHRVTINKAIDKRRQRRSRPESSDIIASLIESEESGLNQTEQENSLVQLELSEKLAGEIGRLPETQARALRLYYFDGRDVATIADLMETTEQAVRSLLKRGRQALRMRLLKQKKTSADDAFEIRGNPSALRASR
jgi:RNA polymerase sigma-70 factor (ECF subfamily)